MGYGRKARLVARVEREKGGEFWLLAPGSASRRETVRLIIALDSTVQ